jgi:hypothetical protein
MTSTETCQKGGSGQDPSGRTMAPWTFNVKFSCGTQLTFVSLIFATGEDRDLTILPPRSAPTHLALASLSTLGGSCSGLDPCQGVTSAPSRSFRVYWSWHPILRPLAGASSSSSSASIPDPDSSNDYPEIGVNACGEPAESDRLIYIVAPEW